MKYLIKLDRWTQDSFTYIIANDTTEVSKVINNLTSEDIIVSITPLNGTVYTAQDWIKDDKPLDK